MNWEDTKRIYYYRLMLDGKLHFFVREERIPMRVREFGWIANKESKDDMDKLVSELNSENAKL